MARVQMTNSELQNLSVEMQELIKHSPAIHFLLKEKVNRFYQQNKLQLQIIDKKKLELAKMYSILDAEDNPVLEEKDGEKHFQFLSDKEKNNYINAWDQFLQRTVCIES